MSEQTTVHLMRHGEVHNPAGVLYGRMAGFHLSDRGRIMAERIGEKIGDRDITHVRISPLERTRETAGPLLARRGLEPVVDERVVESWNKFEGVSFGAGAMTFLKHPSLLRHMYNPFRPSWGEPYADIAARMWAAVGDAREAARGHEAVIVSHQLPVWTVRLFAEKRSYLHDPRSRQCTLCSLTSFQFDGDRLSRVTYSEPVADMIPVGDRSAPFSAGGAPEEDRP